jgi:Pectinacetylesterase
MRTSKFIALLSVAIISAGITAGAGSATAPPTSEPGATAAPASSPATEAPDGATLPPTETATGAGWEKVVPGGDCACADGSEFNYWVRDADPSNVVLFLEGGGACFDATTCAFTPQPSTTYDWNISPDDDPALQRGIFDFSRAENPFADYSFVYVPYCTGDIHLGNKISTYSPELTVEHVGFVNGLTAMDSLRSRFPEATEVVVVGESAGAIAAPLYGGIISDLLPDAQVTVFSDGSGAYPKDQDGAVFDALWNTLANLPGWEVNEGLTASQLSAPQFWIQAGLHDPSMVMSRFDFAYDGVQTAFMTLTGADTSDVGATMVANEAAIEAAGVDQHSFTAPGYSHTLVRSDYFYTMEVEGVSLVDWVSDVVAGEDVADVTCTECGSPAPASTG